MTQKPERITLETIYNRLVEIPDRKDTFVYRDGYAVVLNVRSFFHRTTEMGLPYLLEDYRIGMVRKGNMRIVVNLCETEYTEGTIVFVTPGTIIEPLYISPDFAIEGVGLSEETFHIAHGNALPEIFQGKIRNGAHTATPTHIALLDAMFHLLYTLVCSEDKVNNHTINNIINGITHYYNQIFTTNDSRQDVSSRNTDIFNRFIRLVNLHCRQERSLAYYANRLCITQHYLSSVVSNASGVTAKEWIDRAVITAAKVLLKHSDKQICQISDELCFPNPSFFCKYFRRLVGLTPQEYRTKQTTPPLSQP